MVHHRRNCLLTGDNTSKDDVQKGQICRFKDWSEEFFYSGHIVNNIEVIFDFLAAYSTDLENELTKILEDKRVVSKTIEKSQKWIISQNCEIVKRFASFS